MGMRLSSLWAKARPSDPAACSARRGRQGQATHQGFPHHPRRHLQPSDTALAGPLAGLESASRAGCPRTGWHWSQRPQSAMQETKALISAVTGESRGGSRAAAPGCGFSRGTRDRFNPWVGKIPWSRKWQSTPVFLPGESHGQRSLAGFSLWDCKELDTTEHAHT